MKSALYLKYLAIILAMIQPIIILIDLGNIVSISSVWGTRLQPLFIVTNAITSFFLFNEPKWKLSALCLLLLTAFSVDLFPVLHNWLAGAFFISCFIIMIRIKRYLIYPSLFLCSLLFLFFGNLFWMEFFAIYIICFYHFKLLKIKYRL